MNTETDAKSGIPLVSAHYSMGISFFRKMAWIGTLSLKGSLTGFIEVILRDNETAFALKTAHVVFLPVIFLSFFIGRSYRALRNRWNVPMNIWARDVDLWPTSTNLTTPCQNVIPWNTKTMLKLLHMGCNDTPAPIKSKYMYCTCETQSRKSKNTGASCFCLLTANADLAFLSENGCPPCNHSRSTKASNLYRLDKEMDDDWSSFLWIWEIIYMQFICALKLICPI